MVISRCKCLMLLALLTCLTCVSSKILVEGKISDACHGLSSSNMTYNVLQCEGGSIICITEVRYYQYEPDSGCLHLISSPVPPECCRHNDSRCSWTRTGTSEVDAFQEDCAGKEQCRLHSAKSHLIGTECAVITSIVSSVRSIAYTCTTGTCLSANTTVSGITTASETTTVSESTIVFETTNAPSVTTTTGNGQSPRASDKIGPIVGGVAGSALLVFAIIVIVLFWRFRRQRNPHASTSTPNSRSTGHGSETDTRNDNANIPDRNYYNVAENPSNSQLKMDISGGSTRGNLQPGGVLQAYQNVPLNQESSADVYYNTKDNTDSTTYYNTTPGVDHVYIEVLDNDYNRISLSRMEPENNYTTLK